MHKSLPETEASVRRYKTGNAEDTTFANIENIILFRFKTVHSRFICVFTHKVRRTQVELSCSNLIGLDAKDSLLCPLWRRVQAINNVRRNSRQRFNRPVEGLVEECCAFFKCLHIVCFGYRVRAKFALIATVLFRVLFDQLPPHGQVQDGLTERLDLVGAGGEWGEVVEGEGGVVLKYRWVGVGRIEAGEACRCQSVVCGFPLLLRCF